MALKTSIEWTESTWNPITGCTKISIGCKNCYADRLALRLRAMGSPNYKNGFRLTLHPHVLDLPLSWKKPQMIFVCSMSDVFHEDVPIEFIERIFAVMRKAAGHHFQVLTKRAERLEELSPELPWPDNVWIGVTVESADYLYRLNFLRQSRAKVKFVSFEPLLGPIAVPDLRGIDWVIVGGESGPGARPMQPEWVREIRDKCLESDIPFFFKQWGGTFKKRRGRILDRKKWDQFPAAALTK